MWHIYILKCNDNSFYTGITTDLKKRFNRHNQGKGAEYTKIRRPVELIYSKQYQSKHEAILKEIEIKKLSKVNKEKLITSEGRFPSA